MAEIPSMFFQAVYKNVKNWKVEDIIYLSILNTENVWKMYKTWHVIISFANFWHIYDVTNFKPVAKNALHKQHFIRFNEKQHA